MSDIYALTVGKNEEHRYLESFLENVNDWADDHFFYDDQSEDNTALIAQDYACVRVRTDGEVSFASDEGAFRQYAWWRFIEAFEPREGDWVLVIDCDEVLVAKDGDVRESLERVCNDVVNGAVSLAFNEVFGYSNNGLPLVRMDGFWGLGFAPRLFTYQHGGLFTAGKVGVPAVPSYVMAQSGRWFQTDLISMMHYGYADIGDHLVKYQRYKGQPGHHPQHIESILGPKQLVEWGGSVVEMVHGDS